MTSAPRPPSSTAPDLGLLLQLLAGVAVGAGLVGVVLLAKPNFADSLLAEFRRLVPAIAMEWGAIGAVGGLLGGLTAGPRMAEGAGRVLGLRFWMLALGAGGAVTFGGLALREASARPDSDSGGPAAYVLTYLIVGWLVGVLLGAVGAPFTRPAAPALTAALRKASAGQPEKAAKVMAALLGALAWGVAWGVLVALLAVLGLAVVLVSLHAGGDGPALAIGGTCGCVFFGLRYVLFLRRGAQA